MLHHFHGENHPIGQGSITSNDLDKMISWLRKDFEILSIQEFYEKALKGKLALNETCLTFDDSLLCQYEIALPVIEAHGLKVLFNVYSSAFSGRPDPLEIYRYFRSVYFKNFDDFFDEFFQIIKDDYSTLYIEGMSRFSREKSVYDAYPFYSVNDKVFRFFRDNILESLHYHQIMNDLMNKKKFDSTEVTGKVFMTVPHLVELNLKGHALGLHSDTHPTQIQKLPEASQMFEYRTNYDFLKGITGSGPKIVAHPCGQYNQTTLEILNQLEVGIGFRASLNVPYAKSLLEIPREDHSNLLKKMSKI
jgi:peptidoglycan/xylan/chitin deacetylase (PgdA/CDA1 family)